jgi:hypothetical protein
VSISRAIGGARSWPASSPLSRCRKLPPRQFPTFFMKLLLDNQSTPSSATAEEPRDTPSFPRKLPVSSARSSTEAQCGGFCFRDHVVIVEPPSKGGMSADLSVLTPRSGLAESYLRPFSRAPR